MSLDLRHIRSFRAVAEHGGFRAAAEALGLSQPTLSAHIASLEAELRVTLFSRTSRRVKLTPVGERFLARTRHALDDIDAAAGEMRDEAALEKGRVTLTCLPALISDAVTPALRAFRKKHPAIDIEIVDDDTGMIERRVAEGEVDIGIGPRPARSTQLSYYPIMIDRFVAVFPKEMPIKKGNVVNLTDIAGFPIIASIVGSSMRRTIDTAFRAIDIDFRPVYELRNHSSMLGLAEAGLGVALVPESSAWRWSDRKSRIVAVKNPEISREIGILQRRGEVLRPATAEFVKILKGIASRLKRV